MKKLKSIFISAYLVIVITIALDVIIEIIKSNFSMAWLGAELAALSVLGYFIKIFTLPKPRTKRYINSIISLLAISAALTIIGTIGSLSENMLALVYVILILSGWITYEFWYSNLSKTSKILTFGKSLPEFVMLDQNGKTFNSLSLKNQFTIIMFYRGNWCPFGPCLIKELSDYIKNSQINIQLVFISPQPQLKTRQLVAQLNSSAIFLVDEGNHVAKQLDILSEYGTPFGLQVFGYEWHTVLPTIIMTDMDGKMVYIDIAENYRAHPKPESYIQILEQLPT